ncbi:MAG: hypothetical protein IMW91_10955 [Firmicutes bacterium]|nr:hypothetical protein [Bacillota bacterium]
MCLLFLPALTGYRLGRGRTPFERPLYVSEALREQLRAEAERRGKSVETTVTTLLDEALRDREEETRERYQPIFVPLHLFARLERQALCEGIGIFALAEELLQRALSQPPRDQASRAS